MDDADKITIAICVFLLLIIGGVYFVEQNYVSERPALESIFENQGCEQVEPLVYNCSSCVIDNGNLVCGL